MYLAGTFASIVVIVIAAAASSEMAQDGYGHGHYQRGSDSTGANESESYDLPGLRYPSPYSTDRRARGSSFTRQEGLPNENQHAPSQYANEAVNAATARVDPLGGSHVSEELIAEITARIKREGMSDMWQQGSVNLVSDGCDI